MEHGISAFSARVLMLDQLAQVTIKDYPRLDILPRLLWSRSHSLLSSYAIVSVRYAAAISASFASKPTLASISLWAHE